jgi:hypothetical protein
VSTIDTGTTLDELGKFFKIAGERIDAGLPAPQMFSGAVDLAWHRLTENPAKHDEFTTEHAGRRLDHVESGGEGWIEWVDAYTVAYGPLPEVWFTDAGGTLDAELLGRYRDTGQVWAEWDCSPAPGDGDDLAPAASYL